MPTQPTAPVVTTPHRFRGLSLAGLTAAALLLALWLLLGAAQPPAWAGGNYAILQTYPNPNPAPVTAGGEEFGYSLAYLPNSNQLIVGSRSDQVTTTVPAGLVYLLNASTGAVNRVLSRTVPITADQYGASVTGVLTAVVVGAPKVDISSPTGNDGAVYLYDALSGALIFTYEHPQPITTTNDNFGAAVAIISDTIVVGAPLFNSPTTDAGRVYLCSMTDGTCSGYVDNPTPSSGDQFGLTLISFPGGFAVGAPLDGSHGTVYVYSYDGSVATLSATIATTSTATGDQFGSSLALVGDKLLIGAPNDDTGAVNSGAAYLYTLTGTQLKKFTDTDPHLNDHFGAAVSGNASLILIGAPDDDSGASNAGLIHFYANNGTTYDFIQTVDPTSASADLAFGFAMTPLSGTDFAVSALKADTGATDAGAVYRVGYQAIPPTPTATATSTGVPNGVFLPLTTKP